jgi:glycosyltransferase involved in cell wall biosynthesis
MSKSEGFATVSLEAMACGTPVITSSVASLPEVCGDAAMYVDPLSERDIAEKIWSLCESLKAREVLRSKGFERVKNFSWSRFADGTWKIYEDVARGKYER